MLLIMTIESASLGMYNHIVVFFFLSVTLTTADNDICKNGTTCLPIENCSFLYYRLQIGYDIIQRLLRKLHCGFDIHSNPMICCPDLLPPTTVCGIQNNDRIFGGERADLDELPWTALIRYDTPKGSRFACGGVLISSRYVMTAAHCVKSSDLHQNWALTQVRLGEWNLATNKDCVGDDCSLDPTDINVEEVIAHEDYNPAAGQQNDIALLRLAQDVSFNDFVKPICLPIDPVLRKNTFEGSDMVVAGWGKTETNYTSDIKLKVTVKVRNTQVCKEIYRQGNRVITEKELCAGGVGHRDACMGDSGGALMGQLGPSKNWMAVGVVSYGPTPCGAEGWPGVYTRVTAYIDWIVSKLRP